MSGHVACSVGECGGAVLALGLCRKHYMRQRKHGDTGSLARPGPAVSEHVTAMDAAGVSSHQRHRWAAAGLLGVELDPATNRYTWTADSARRAAWIRRLTGVGFPLGTAAEAARAFVETGAWSVELDPGITLTVHLPASGHVATQ